MSKKILSRAKRWGPEGLLVTPTDRQIFREDIDWFLPEKIFDMHTHIHLGVAGSVERVSMSLLQELQKKIYPKRICNDLILPFPFEGQGVEQANEYAFRQFRKFAKADDATLMFVEPSMSAGYVREQVLKNNAVGLKVYMFHSQAKDKTNAPLRSFLPEKHIEVMNELGLMVMLHLSKPRAISDPANIRDVETLSRRYPNSKWVLAHCARCFRPGMFDKVVDRLNKLSNVYVETSAVCEPLVFMEIFKNYDLSRLMFGSDNVLAGAPRGRYVEIGLFWDVVDWTYFARPESKFLREPTFVIYEQLRAMSRAAKLVGLSKKNIREMFWGNAMRLLKSIDHNHNSCWL